MNHQERKHFATLVKRRDFLIQRIAGAPVDKVSYDCAEEAALTWILNEFLSSRPVRVEEVVTS